MVQQTVDVMHGLLITPLPSPTSILGVFLIALVFGRIGAAKSHSFVISLRDARRLAMLILSLTTMSEPSYPPWDKELVEWRVLYIP